MIADVLQLTADQRSYAEGLAAQADRRSPAPRRSTSVRPQVQRLLEKLIDQPEFVVGKYLDILAWNRLTAAIMRWTLLGPMTVVGVVVLFLADPSLIARPPTTPEVADALLPVLPLLIAGPLLNAAAEELLYRHALLGTLGPVIGTMPAVLTSSLRFGVAHLTGNPPGWVGVLATFL